MALIICGDCQKEYSDYALACPKCARPTISQKIIEDNSSKKIDNSINQIKDLFKRFLKQNNFELTESEKEATAKKKLDAKKAAEAKKKLDAKKATEAKKKLDMKILILLIADDRDMRDLIAEHLGYSGYDVLKADDGIKGQALALQYSPDFILLDLMLPNVDGLTLCQRLRRDDRTSSIPILMMTALGGLKDKVTGFNAGADDYITKPFDLEELHVRIKALLRRTNRAVLNSTNQQEILNYGSLTLVPERFEVIWFNSPVRLTFYEFELLYCLLQRHGQTVSLDLILQEVWGYEADDDVEIIRTCVKRLRTKLEKDPKKPKFIKTVYGLGYSLQLQ